MFIHLLQTISQNLLYFMLHLTSGNSFPKPLSAKDEKEALRAFHEEGDRNAREKLIKHNMRLVAHIVKKYYANYSDQDDIISIGTIGLIKGIDSFDNTKSTHLATYASRCIENEILMHLRRTSKTKLEVSIDEPLNVDWDGNELLLSDILGTDDDVISKDMESEVEKNLLRNAVDRLSGRERMIVELRFGYNTPEGNEMTQKEVADLLGISQSYISRLEKKIMKRLRREIVRFE